MPSITIEQKTALKPAKLILEYCPWDAENPNSEAQCDGWGWVIYSFSSRHTDFKHPENFFPPNIGLKKKLEAGTAFVLSCYQHSGIAWSLQGEGMQCRWDTCNCAGIMIWQGKAKDAGKDRAERAERARKSLETHNDWCNGQCFRFRLEDLAGDELDSCGTYIGTDDLASALREAIKSQEVEVVEVSGDAEGMYQYLDLKEKPHEKNTD